MEIFVLTIIFDNSGDHELKRILNVLGKDFVDELVWDVQGLEWLGADRASQFNLEVDVAAGNRIRIRGGKLFELAEDVWQTIEGQFIGYGSEDLDFLEKDSPLSWFAKSPAKVGLEFRDGSLCDVYLRSKELAERLASHFPKVIWQDVNDFILDE